MIDTNKFDLNLLNRFNLPTNKHDLSEYISNKYLQLLDDNLTYRSWNGFPELNNQLSSSNN